MDFNFAVWFPEEVLIPRNMIRLLVILLTMRRVLFRSCRPERFADFPLGHGGCTNTVWGYMIVLKHIVSIARNDGHLPFNPFAGYINSPESVDSGGLPPHGFYLPQG